MSRAFSVALGVVVAQEKSDNPWQEYTWRPISVFLNAPEIAEWRELRRGPQFVHYHAATLPLQLHPKDTPGYKANLDEEAPCVYVVLRQRPDGGDPPTEVAHVTVSGDEAAAYGYVMEETVANVAMPQPLLEAVAAFVEEHHVDQPFVKRQRQKHHRKEEYTFGQEPIVALRERMRKAAAGEKQDE
jgi:hypothetical protein